MPYGINFGMKGKDIIAKLGEPNLKKGYLIIFLINIKGGGAVMIQLIYENIGIEFNMVSTVWD